MSIVGLDVWARDMIVRGTIAYARSHNDAVAQSDVAQLERFHKTV